MSCEGLISHSHCKIGANTPQSGRRLKERQKDSLQRGLPIPGEASPREHYLCNEVDALDLATAKRFHPPLRH
jgi:hypothetical protein